MKYEKPSVQPLAAVVSSVQHPMEKCCCGILETINPNTYFSLAAYEVDE
jgi:hypothetical protein